MIDIVDQKSFHIEELAALQFGWQIDFTQLGPAERESTVNLVRTDNVGVCHFQFNSGFDQRLHAQPDYYSFGLPDPSASGATVLEKVAQPGAIIVFPHDNQAHGVSPAGFHGYGAHIRAALLESLAETVFRMPLRLLVPVAGVYQLTDMQFRHVYWEMQKWQEIVAASTAADASLLAQREEALGIAILSSLGHSSPAAEAPYQKSGRAIKLVLDYLDSTPPGEITASELCSLADCSQRWLEQSFKKRFGVTPMAYVKYLRLARLRRDLLQATHDQTVTVNDLASTYGFWHMGQLAADYRKVYDELPSATLKRR